MKRFIAWLFGIDVPSEDERLMTLATSKGLMLEVQRNDHGGVAWFRTYPMTEVQIPRGPQASQPPNSGGQPQHQRQYQQQGGGRPGAKPNGPDNRPTR